MFKQISDYYESRGPSREYSVDPEQFGDPVALKTSWRPMKRGGTTFSTHVLVATEPSRYEFKTSIGLMAFCLLFAAVGISVILFAFSDIMQNSFTQLGPSIFLVPFALVFAGVSLLILRYMGMPIVFDKKEAFCWKGWSRVAKRIAGEASKDCCKLSEIYALQLIAEYCHLQGSRFKSYELNLVLADGSRMNVVDHGNIRLLRQHTEELSRFLEKPVWDGSFV